jgi:hypothetical protein
LFALANEAFLLALVTILKQPPHNVVSHILD